MRIGIMGGTFDPIHLGHLIAAECARTEHELDEVWFMPAHVPPHKSHAPEASGEERLEMVRRAIAGHPHFRPFDYELRKGGVSYSVDTVNDLVKSYPQRTFHYIIGGDMVAYLPQWVRIEEIIRHIRFIGLHRHGFPIQVSELPKPIADAVVTAIMPTIDISSTLIRSRCKNGLSVRYMIPDSVHEYIRERKMYGS